MSEEAEVIEAEETQEAPQEGAEEHQEQPKQSDPPTWAQEDEDEARLFGWKPPAEWHGELPEGYIQTPDEYLGRVKRSRIFQTMERKLEDQAEILRKNEAMNAKALERQRAQHKSEMDQVVQDQRRAVEEADTETYDRLEAKRQNLLQNAPMDVQTQTNQNVSSDVSAYQASEDGAWLKDPVLFQAGVQIIDTTPGASAMSPMEQISFAREKVAEIYPSRFPSKPAQTKPRAVVDGGGLAPGGKVGGTAYDKLPTEAKTNFKRFASEGLYADTKEGREEYANEYNAS